MEEETKLLDLDGLTYYNGKIQGQLGDIQNDVDGKQATLVSGTNIKTINNTSLLGSGDISIGSGDVIITDSNYSSQSTISAVNTEYQKYLNGESYHIYYNGAVDGSSYIGTRELYFESVAGGIYLFSPLHWTLSQSNNKRLLGAKYFMCTKSNGQITSLGNPQNARVYIGSSTTSTLISYDNFFEYTPSGDYNPATKKYVDDMVGDINSVLATLTTPTTPSI